MAATAEFVPEVFQGERYCGSLTAEREWYGAITLQAAGVEVEQIQVEAIVESAFDDHVTALTENIVTDEEYAEELVFGTPKVRQIVDGHVVSKTGRPVIDVVETGVKYSRQMAEDDPVFEHQAVRDEGDLLYMQVVDDLEVGEIAHMVSMDPKGWYATHPDLCDSIGYREGMAIQHIAYRSDEDTMLMWTYAIKQSDTEAMAQVYSQDYGIHIPVGTDPDMWSRYVHRATMPRQWAEQIGPRTQQRHAEIVGSAVQHYSVDEFMAENIGEIKQIFDAYMPRIMTAIGTRQNDAELQSLAGHILGVAGEGLKTEVRSRLLRIANSNRFDDDDGRLMKVMMRYATLEQLRSRIPEYKARIDSRADPHSTPALTTEQTVYALIPEVYPSAGQQFYAELNRSMAQHISIGVAARRSVGGCSGISLSDTERNPLRQGLPEPYNDIFSRVDLEEATDYGQGDEDEYGPLVFECTEGHENKRPKGKLIEVCQTKGCKGSVGCG